MAGDRRSLSVLGISQRLGSYFWLYLFCMPLLGPVLGGVMSATENLYRRTLHSYSIEFPVGEEELAMFKTILMTRLEVFTPIAVLLIRCSPKVVIGAYCMTKISLHLSMQTTKNHERLETFIGYVSIWYLVLGCFK